MPDAFRLVLRTPHEDVFDEEVRAARVPTATGQVGLRPRAEPLLLVVEPGLVIVRDGARVRFAATAGGLLEGERRRCTLYTPIAVAGSSEEEVLAALDRLLSMPDREAAVRRQLAELERRIARELRGSPPPAGSTRSGHEQALG